MPQVPGPVWQVNVQSTPEPDPPLLVSFVTTAVIGVDTLSTVELGGVGWKAMDRPAAGGAGGFCTFAVLPLLHPASAIVSIAVRERRIHRLGATCPTS